MALNFNVKAIDSELSLCNILLSMITSYRMLNTKRSREEAKNNKEWIAEVNDKRKKVFAEFGKMER